MTAAFKERLQRVARILVVNPRGLGDVIHSLPTVAALKRSCPAAEIDFLASAHSEHLFDIIPDVRAAVTVSYYPKPKTRWERYARRLSTARRIRHNAYDAVSICRRSTAP